MAKKYYLDKTGLGRIVSWVKGLFASHASRLDSIERNAVTDNLLAPACEALTATELKKAYTFTGGEFKQYTGQMNGFYTHYDEGTDSQFPMVRVTKHGTEFWLPLTAGETYTLLWGEMWQDGDETHREYNTVGQQYTAVIGLSGNEFARKAVTPRTSAVHTLTFTATATGNARVYFIWKGTAMKCLTVMMMQLYRGVVTQMNPHWYKWYQLDKLLDAQA